MNNKGVVISTSTPADEIRGSVLRMYILLNTFNNNKWVFCPSMLKSKSIVIDGINIKYFPLTIFDICRAVILFFQGYPISNIIFQRRAINEELKSNDEVIYHLSRTFQHSRPKNKVTIDLCESLSDNYRLRAYLLSIFSLKKILFNYEAKRVSKFEKSLAENPEIKTLFISSNDSLIPIAKNYTILPNSILSTPPKKTSNVINNRKVVFLGQVDYEPNLYSIINTSKMLNLIDTKYQLHVIGSLNNRSRKTLSGFGNIFLHGFIENLDDVMSDALCGVALIDNSTGMQNKVLDYFFYGLPALVSRKVYLGLPKECPSLIIDDIEDLKLKLIDCCDIENRINLQDKGYTFLKKINNSINPYKLN